MKNKFKINVLTFLSAAVLGTTMSGSSIAAPRVTVKQFNYGISGNNIDEIKKAIAENAPESRNGRGYSALTKYDIAWNYTFDKSGKNCKIDSVTTSVVITKNIPKLENINRLDEETKSQWNQYFTSLQTHEEGHADLGIEAAHEIEKEIARLKPTSTCTKLSIEANKLARNIINYYHNKNVNYDTETVHGHMQGAFLGSYQNFN